MTFEEIHNYYEPLVIDEVMRTLSTADASEDFLEDVACLALNRLPSRYVRHDVDMAFFLTSDERQQMHQAVRDAVAEAATYVSESRAKRLSAG